MNTPELADLIYDRLMGNENMTPAHKLFPVDDLIEQEVNAREGTIYLEFEDDAFELVIRKVSPERNSENEFLNCQECGCCITGNEFYTNKGLCDECVDVIQ